MATNINQEELLHRLKAISAKGVLDADNADRRENMHRLFMYPAMMVPATQSAIINIFADFLPEDAFAIDPFMGSGTSLLSCMEFGFNVFGQDINPFAVLLSRAKTTAYDITSLKDAHSRIVERIEKDKSSHIAISFPNIDKWFTKESQIDFSKIRRAIQLESDSSIRIFFWVLMSEAIRIGSNDRTSTFKLHCRSKEELEHRNVNVLKEFSTIAKRGIEDYSLFCNKLQTEHAATNMDFRGITEIKWGNTQLGIESDHKFNLLVSSPPYGDNNTTVTYGQTSYLPLQWIDLKDIECPFDYLKTTQEIDRQSLGGKIDSKTLINKTEYLFTRSPRFKEFFNRVPSNEKHKYKKTISFIYDFNESLIHILDVMEPDAYYIWTIGNRFVGGREIPNSEVLEDLMHYNGIDLFFRAERQILNKKQACKNNYSKTMEKELILIFQRKNK